MLEGKRGFHYIAVFAQKYAVRVSEFVRKLPASRRPQRKCRKTTLACYEAQIGSLDRAKAHLKRATEIDAKFSLMALEDPDLEPLWVSLPTDRT